MMRKSRNDEVMRLSLSDSEYRNQSVVGNLSAIEGDMLRHRDGSLWVVKGCVHSSEGLVALPRVFEGRKVKRYSEAMGVIERYYPHYITYLEELGRDVPVVPWGDILRVLSWLHEGRHHWVEGVSELLRLLSDVGLECGIAGSYLGGYFGVESDIDVHCLDSPGAYEKIQQLYTSGILEHLSYFDACYEVTEVSESLREDIHIGMLTRKYLQGKFRNRRVTIRILGCDRIAEFLGPYHSVRWGELVVKVVESDYRTPAIMRAHVVRSSVSVDNLVYLISHRARFTELPSGTILKVSGLVRTNSLGRTIVNLDESTVDWIGL
jgi:hypothetical protein